MDTVQATIARLTQVNLHDDERRIALRTFANHTGWHPSDEILRYRDTVTYATGHLLVDHGLDHTAVISFLANGSPFSQLSYSQQRTLIGISYNNLVDWHLFPDPNGLCRVYNRRNPLMIEYISIHEHADAYRADAFDHVVGRKESPNVPALDDALLGTVSRWRRILASELALASETDAIAELFNAIFFVRALEDDQRNRGTPPASTLLDAANQNAGVPLRQILSGQLANTTKQHMPANLLDFEALQRFDALDSETLIELFSEFYENRFAPYAFDFSLMSKHALSRIYERYISILRPVEVSQATLFPISESVSEVRRKDLGEVYTPQYIAKFFARFLQENMTPSRFRSLRAIDPACGSGMFLRTLSNRT